MKHKANCVHKDLRSPKYRMRVVSIKTAYKRKPKNSKDNYHDDRKSYA